MSTRRFRSPVIRGHKTFLDDSPKFVDRESGIIHGFAVATVGEAEGHGLQVDVTTLDQIVEQGNAAPNGVKSRFTHPNMSNDGMGTQIGRARKFRRDGDIARADLHLHQNVTSARRQDMISDVLDMAEEAPDQFGSSIVAFIDEETPLNDKGNPDAEAMPLIRVRSLRATDIVDEPAANEGLFSQFDRVDRTEAAAMATRFLDWMFAGLSAEEKRDAIGEFMVRYLGSEQCHLVTNQSRNSCGDLRRMRHSLNLARNALS